jgi:hypothetical protein
MPGFGPAAEVLLFRQKDPKPWTPRPASLKEVDASHRRATQLAALKQGPPIHQSIHQGGQAAGVGWKEGASIVACCDAFFKRVLKSGAQGKKNREIL